MFKKLFCLVSFLISFVKSVFTMKTKDIGDSSNQSSTSTNEKEIREEILDENEEIIENILKVGKKSSVTPTGDLSDTDEEIEQEETEEKSTENHSEQKTLEMAKARFDLELFDVREEENFEHGIEIVHRLVETTEGKSIVVDSSKPISRSKRKHLPTSDKLIPYREGDHINRAELPVLLAYILNSYEEKGIAVKAIYRVHIPGFKVLEP